MAAVSSDGPSSVTSGRFPAQSASMIRLNSGPGLPPQRAPGAKAFLSGPRRAGHLL